MNVLNRMMSYDKTKNVNQKCDCEEGINIKVENQTVEYPPLTEEEIEQIIEERYSDKDKKTKTFIRKALRVHGDKYDYSNVIYIKSDIKVEIICRVENHESFWQTPNGHLNGNGCKKCQYKKLSSQLASSLNNFVEKSNETHGFGRYDYSKVVYKNNKTKVCIICHNHGFEPYEFWQKPNDHLNGQGCPKCRNEIKGEKLRLGLKKFIERANKIHGIGRYDYSKVYYKNGKIKVCIICKNHDEPYEFWQTPNDHLDNHGCPICGGNLKLNLNEFKKRGNKKHGEGRYDYSESEYVDCQTLIKIICPKEGHGEFWQKPYIHLSGRGCPICCESQGEKKIRIFLTNSGIEFEQEKRFDDCSYKNPLPFDFYLPQYNLCIEFDGRQHFIPFDFSSKLTKEKKLENLKFLQIKDQIKNEYCKNNKINLLRIKYNENVEEKLTEYFQNHKV